RWPVLERGVRASRRDDAHPAVYCAKDQMAGELRRPRRADKGGSGRDYRAVLAAVIGLWLVRRAGGRRQRVAVPVRVGPWIAFAPLHVQDEDVIAGGWRARVAARTIAGDRDLPGRRHSDAEGVSDSVRPDRIGRAERVV